MYEKLLTVFISGAGSKIGSRIMELFDEQTARMVRIEEKIDKIYDAVLELGLKQDLLFFTDRKKKILSDISIFKSYLNGVQTPSKENLSNISQRFIVTSDFSFIRHINNFITEIIGADLSDGIFRNSFTVDPEDFRKGALFKYAGNVLCKDDVSLPDYIRNLTDFASIFIYDLQKLSEAYWLAYQILQKSGLTDNSNPKLDIEPRWCRENGLAKDLMPLLAECVRYVAGPALLLSETSQNKWRIRPASVIMKHNNWILENKDGYEVYTGYNAENDKLPTFGLSPHNSYRLWYVHRATDSETDRISLAGATDPSKFLTYIGGQNNNTPTQLKPPHKESTQCFILKVYKTKTNDPIQWFKLSYRGAVCDSDLVADRSLGNWIGLYKKVQIASSYMMAGVGDDFRRFAFVFWRDRLFTGEFLQAGQSLSNISNSKYQLQFDVNQGLVVYENEKHIGTVWAKPGNVTINENWRVYVGLNALHLYSGSKAYVDNPPPVQSEKDPSYLSMLIMQDDGNVVVYEYKGDNRTATALWDKNHPIAVVLYS